MGRIYRRAGIPVVDAWQEMSPQDGPFVLFLDDAHKVGDERLRELRALVEARRPGIVLAYRPWPRPAALGELLELLRLDGPPLVLSPFTVEQTAKHLGVEPDSPAARHVHAQTGGVPRLVDRLGPAAGEGLPPQALVQFRPDLDDLDADLRALLLAAATGVELPTDLLGALLDRTPDAVDDLLDAARASGLVAPDGRLVPAACKAVASLSPAAHRTAVWQRLAELQLARGGAVLPLVRALREAGVSGGGLATMFEAAGEEALIGEPALAAELFAVAAAAGRPTDARRALAAALAGDLDVGLRLADRLVAAEGSPDRAVGAAVSGSALAHRGQLGRSAELYRWSGTTSSVSFAALGFIGTGQLGRADDLVPPDGPPTLLTGAAALMASGIRESLSGSATAALSTLVQAAALLEPAGRAVLLPDSPAALAALVAIHCGELDTGESVLDRAIGAEVGAALMARRHRLLQGWMQMVRGRTAAAAEHRAAASNGPLEPRDLLFATALDAGIARRNSDLAALHRAWAQAREAVMRQPVDLYSLLPIGELTVAAARLGEQARMATHMAEAWRLLDRLGRPPLWTAPLHWCGLHAAIIAEEPTTADEHAAALVATAQHSRYGSVVAAAAESWLETLRGAVDPAKVEAAARGLHGAGLWWDGARLAGQAAIRTADRKAMTALLDCARLLQGSARGGGSPAAVQPAVSQVTEAFTAPAESLLSEREQEVADLVLDGLTYRQIGDRLFISAKTVEHHMARMRQRLGCANRGDLLAKLRAMSADRSGAASRRAPWPRRPMD
ncbi:helix-turn-helix transcriptional regulator [Phytohabitans houttuyneae]|uniref:Helix-turn-helix transcriptional regulator n=1 Tax=Phytohabitans houttuyneae TaxID=1076126 RepID=A0A6V8KE94_9ACTN|nr:helix-turn-helix transcriptional regulator [Phytohabitans houttuyneae]